MMQQKSDKTNHVFLSLIKFGLVTYTAIRSIDLVMGTMPASIKIFAVAVVCGLDLALLAWDDYAAHRSKSGTQHTIGVIMIVVNMLGIGAAMIADTATVIDAEGSRSMITTIALFVIPAIVLANVGAIIAVGQADPDRKLAEMQANHERDLSMTRSLHDQALVNQRQALELELEKLGNTKRLDALKDDYIRTLGSVAPATKPSQGGGDPVVSELSALRNEINQLRALREYEATHPKSPDNSKG